MVVVRCLILCSKFAKNCLSAGLRPDPLGELTALPRPAGSWGRERKGEIEWQEGEGRKRGGEDQARKDGRGRRGNGKGRGRVIPLRMKILATALI